MSNIYSGRYILMGLQFGGPSIDPFSLFSHQLQEYMKSQIHDAKGDHKLVRKLIFFLKLISITIYQMLISVTFYTIVNWNATLWLMKSSETGNHKPCLWLTSLSEISSCHPWATEFPQTQGLCRLGLISSLIAHSSPQTPTHPPGKIAKCNAESETWVISI
jgi:hypothetical protein